MVDKKLDMNYSIEINVNFTETNKLFNILIDGKILNTFNPIAIMSLDIEKVPLFLQSVIDEKDYDVMDYSRISFGEYEFDGEILVPKGMVGFSVFDDRTIISKKDFLELCLQLGMKSLEVFEKFDLKVDGTVRDDINKLIPLLEGKIKLV